MAEQAWYVVRMSRRSPSSSPLVATPAVALAVAALGLAAGWGCATGPQANDSTALRARDYYPLAVGNTWEYRVTPAPPDAPNGQVKILDKDAHGYFVDNHGSKLAPRTDGVFDGERFLLQEPVEEGHEWIAVPRDQPSVVEHYKITAVGTRAHVPAGNFDGCVEVEAKQDAKNPKTGERAELKMTWTYAPGVGLVKAVQVVKPDQQPPRTTMTMELVRFEVKPAT